MAEALLFFSLLCLLCVWVALPLLPAVLIYHKFPNTPVAVSGPLANLTVNAGGAFAAYLVVFVVVVPLVQTIEDVIGGWLRPFWEIRGEVKLVDQNGRDIVLRQKIDWGTMTLETKPEALHHDGEILILKIPEESGGNLPRIYIQVPQWGKAYIDVDEEPWVRKWWERDSFHRVIKVGQIPVRRIPPIETYDSLLPMDAPTVHGNP